MPRLKVRHKVFLRLPLFFMMRRHLPLEELRQYVADDPTNYGKVWMLASYLATEKKLDEALVVVQAAVTISPTDRCLHRMLALALDESGQFQDAIAAYQETLRLGWPDYHGEIHLRIGDLLYLLGERDRARAEWETVIVVAEAYRVAGTFNHLPRWVRLIIPLSSGIPRARSRLKRYGRG